MIGRTISHYRIIEKLGEGGMGVVYRAEDTTLERPVALKFLPSHVGTCDEAKGRFLREARAAAALNHPNVCTVYEIGEADGQVFIAMAFVEGRSLRHRIADGPLELPEAVDIAIQIAEGLAAAHEKGIAHRDVKPDNVMITPRGRAKVMDFGLAKSCGDVALTSTDSTVGTVAYMSPEQSRSEDVDHRTDLWSLGVVLYEMVTGCRPFRGDYDQAVVYSILNEEPQPAVELRSGLPDELSRVIAKALTKDPGRRYQTSDELLTDLRALRSQLGATSTEVSSADPFPSIAVLPFANMSADPEQEFFCDGMAEEIINSLAQLDGLRVVARTSAFAFKGEHTDIREVGEKLNVEIVLEGSVRKAGNRLRIATQLINVDDGYHIWSERYDREMEDVFAIQDEISRAIVGKLKGRLLPQHETPRPARGTDDAEAYRLYLKGRFYWNKRMPEPVRKSIECFRQAIERDPDFAEAYAGLADGYSILENLLAIDPEIAFRETEAAATRALELAPGLAEPHASSAWLKMLRDWDWAGGEAELRRAIELNPGYATAHQWLSIYLTAAGRHQEALAEVKRAQELDPLSPIIGSLLGVTLGVQDLYDEALVAFRRVLEIDPTFAPALLGLSDTYLDMGMHKEASSVLDEAASVPGADKWVGPQLVHLYAHTGREKEARALLDELEASTGDNALPRTQVAALHAELGDDEAALALLEEVCQTRSSEIMFLFMSPEFDHLRSLPRFQALIERIGILR